MAAITHRLRCEILEARRLTAIDVAEGLNITVQSEGLAGLRAAEIRLDYDANNLTLKDNDIQLGAAWKGNASLVTKVDDVNGSVNIFLFTAQPISASSGGLVEVKFELEGDVATDVAMATLSKLQLNEGEIGSNGVLKSTPAFDRQDPPASDEVETEISNIHTVVQHEVTSDVGIENHASEPAPVVEVIELDTTEPKACTPWVSTAYEAVAVDSSMATPPIEIKRT